MTLRDTTLMESQQKTLRNGWKKFEMPGESLFVFFSSTDCSVAIHIFSQSSWMKRFYMYRHLHQF